MNGALKHGVYLGGFLVAYGIAFRLMGLDHHSPLSWVFYLALPVAAFWSLKTLAKDGPQNYLSGTLRASAMILVGSAIYCAYVYLFNAFVDASLIENLRAEQLASLDPANPAAEKQKAQIEQLTTPGGFAVAVYIQLVVVGVAASALIAPFTRSKAAA